MIKKKILAFLFLYMHFFYCFSQDWCGTSQYYGQMKALYPGLNHDEDSLENIITQYTIAKNFSIEEDPSRSLVATIPVVVHLIGDDVITAISSGLYYKVQQQIDILNQDYRRLPASSGYGSGVDTRIQFCLANIDPLGGTTTGITEHPGVNSIIDRTYNTDDMDLKGLVHWDPNKYLNIYVVLTIQRTDYNTNQTVAIAGYSSSPTSMALARHLDGVVISIDHFGKTASATQGEGRTATHEIGHWLGLKHPWGDVNAINNCTGSDNVDDTPICPYDPTPVIWPSCTALHQCTAENTAIGLTDVRQVENYMDYSADLCQSKFTNGQSYRMHVILQTTRAFLMESAITNCTATVPNHCLNGVQDSDETGIDCGGSECPSCQTVSHCSNGYIDADELGVDCGGFDCNPCPPTCTDGIKNGNETGIDCGGSCAIPCHCKNGIQDGNETAIDCGGDCVACININICSEDNPFPIHIQFYPSFNGTTCVSWLDPNYPSTKCLAHLLKHGAVEVIKSQSIVVSSFLQQSYSTAELSAKDYIDIKTDSYCGASGNMTQGLNAIDIAFGAYFDAKIENYNCTSNYSAYTNNPCGGNSLGKTDFLTSEYNFENPKAESLQMYPNPASSTLIIKCSSLNIIQDIIVYDLLGGVIFSMNSNGINEYNVPLTSIANGSYFCKVVTEHFTTTRFFIKQ